MKRHRITSLSVGVLLLTIHVSASAAFRYLPADDAAYFPINNFSFRGFTLFDPWLSVAGSGLINVNFTYRDTVSSAGGGADVTGWLKLVAGQVEQWDITLHNFDRYGDLLAKSRFDDTGFSESMRAIEGGGGGNLLSEGPVFSGSPGRWQTLPFVVPIPPASVALSSALLLGMLRVRSVKRGAAH